MRTAAPTLARMLGSWQLDPGVLVVCAATAALYGWGVVRARRRTRGHWPLWRRRFVHGRPARADVRAAVRDRSLFRRAALDPRRPAPAADPARAGAAAVGRSGAAGAERLRARGTARDRSGPARALGAGADAAGVRVRAVHDRRARHPPDGPLRSSRCAIRPSTTSSTPPTSGRASSSCCPCSRPTRSPTRRARSRGSRG